MKKLISLIGAGPTGCLLALYLARQGYQVKIYERRPDMRQKHIPSGRSINLALANRGMASLRELGLGQQIDQLLIAMKGRMVHERQGQQFQAYGASDKEMIYSVNRNDLNKLLLNAVEATGQAEIHFNQRCTEVDFSQSLLHLFDERLREQQLCPFDCVFGTDGSGSTVRKATIHASCGQSVFSPLGHGYKEMVLPAAAGGKFQLDPHSLHIWPRNYFMLIALPNLGGSFTLTLFLPTTGDAFGQDANEHAGRASFATINGAEQIEAFFLTYFPDIVPGISMAKIIAQFQTNPIGNISTLRCQGWHFQDRALLLGDAAHAIAPFHGQGLNAGFESCQALDQQLQLYPDNWQRAFATFEAMRKPNTDAIAAMALENFTEMSRDVLDEGFRLKSAVAFELEKRFPEVFIPRYSMVMFHTLPYAEAQIRGRAQQEILECLTQDISTVSQLDFQKAEHLIKSHPNLQGRVS